MKYLISFLIFVSFNSGTYSAQIDLEEYYESTQNIKASFLDTSFNYYSRMELSEIKPLLKIMDNHKQNDYLSQKIFFIICEKIDTISDQNQLIPYIKLSKELMSDTNEIYQYTPFFILYSFASIIHKYHLSCDTLYFNQVIKYLASNINSNLNCYVSAENISTLGEGLVKEGINSLFHNIIYSSKLSRSDKKKLEEEVVSILKIKVSVETIDKAWDKIKYRILYQNE